MYIKLPRYALHTYSREAVDMTETEDGATGHVRQSYSLRSEFMPFGVSAIRFADTGVWAKLSSKILKEDYSRLIGWDTVDAALSALSTDVLQFDPEVIIEEGRLYRADVAADIHILEIDETMEALRLAPVEHNWRVNDHRPNGKIWTKTTTTPEAKRRLSIYPKWEELELRRNRELLKYINRNHFLHVLRLELNLLSGSAIRRVFGVPEPTLLHILSSPRNPLSKIIEEVGLKDFKEPIRHDDESYQQMLNRRAREFVAADLGWDPVRLREFIKTQCSNVSREWSKYVPVLEEHAAEQIHIAGHDGLITALRRRLDRPLF